MWAFGIGALSAVSLPLGSLVGLKTRLRPLTLALLAAFGAGALIAALSVELVAPTVSALTHGGALPHAWLVLAEGLAAGAMLTMIASTMIPEAVHLGNPPVVGLGTLAGFLAAIVFKLLE